MKENHSTDQNTGDHWIEELLAISEDAKMTPKQIAILQAAIEVFSEKGFSATSTSEIAQKAGVAEGTIFRYYKTKNDLLLSIVRPAISRMIAPFVLRNFNGVLDVRYESLEELLRALILNRLDFARNNLKIIKILIQEIPFQPILREQFMENITVEVHERFTVLTEHFKERGMVIDAPTPAILRFTISSIIGFLFTRLLLMPETIWNDEEEINLTIRFIMHGIGGQNVDRSTNPAGNL